MSVLVVCHVVHVGWSSDVTFAVFEHTVMRCNEFALVHVTCVTVRTLVFVSDDLCVVLCLEQDDFTTDRVGIR